MTSRNKESKLVLVTGGAGGIGSRLCYHLAKNGYDVAIIDVAADASATLESQLNSEFQGCSTVKAYVADVCDRKAIADIRNCISEQFSSVYGLVTLAAIGQQEDALTLTDEDWDRMIGVHLKGSFVAATVFAPLMIERGGGRIVMCASKSGIIVNKTARHCHYNAAKAGIIQLARSLASEWAQFQITCNSVSPGYIMTPMTEHRTAEHPIWIKDIPIGRLGLPDDVANAVLFLMSPQSSFITGQNIIIDGGYTVW